MYTYILDEGVMIRDVDEVVVAPCQSNEEPNFVEYVNWIIAGGEPAYIDTRAS
jgi:hypothetical protein